MIYKMTPTRRMSSITTYEKNSQYYDRATRGIVNVYVAVCHGGALTHINVVGVERRYHSMPGCSTHNTIRSITLVLVVK